MNTIVTPFEEESLYSIIYQNEEVAYKEIVIELFPYVRIVECRESWYAQMYRVEYIDYKGNFCHADFSESEFKDMAKIKAYGYVFELIRDNKVYKEPVKLIFADKQERFVSSGELDNISFIELIELYRAEFMDDTYEVILMSKDKITWHEVYRA